jgi:hypothetical protein
VMEKQDVAIQLRMLQTLGQIGTERNHTVIVPLPVDIIRTILGGARKA